MMHNNKHFMSAVILAALVSANSTDYSQNGRNWDAGFCQTGSMQSPIDLPSEQGLTRVDEMDLTFSEKNFPTSVKVNNSEK